MNKRTIGALAMVLVGSVTFSVTNSLLADDTINRKDQANELTIPSKQNTNDSINQTEKQLHIQTTKAVEDTDETKNTVKAPLATININKSKTTSSNKMKLNTETSSNKTITQTQKRTATSTTAPAANATATTSKPITNQKTITTTNKTTTTSQTSSKTTATATPTISAAPTTTTTNHGNQVSQDAREKALSRKVVQKSNGKNK
ncbi:hypothetical protein [Neobacillus cucumis]|uniref:hypothetical protein n=1 Tax=Neobacillus cucumis TaxID=1740721 RepID=UPI001963F233|nr:hypothetical protein [Neobacillus cucumis]MBM7653290.1 thiol:disulfide interchange protein [Neobacillus cucumis]